MELYFNGNIVIKFIFSRGKKKNKRNIIKKNREILRKIIIKKYYKEIIKKNIIKKKYLFINFRKKYILEKLLKIIV